MPEVFSEDAGVAVSGASGLAELAIRRGNLSLLGEANLRPGDDLVRGRRQHELDAVVLVRSHRRRNVEGRELNVFCPTAALPVISAGVKRAAHDGVSGYLFAMAVAKDQHCRRFRLIGALSGPWRVARLGFGVIRRSIHTAFRGLLP